jgi:hypothetical protein
LPERSAQRTVWEIAALLAWLATGVLLAWVVTEYAGYAADVVVYPYSLDYSEGVIWQQALWIPGPHMYGDISHYPFLVFEYPPLYHMFVRTISATGLDTLAVGRAVSVASAVVTAGLIGSLVIYLCSRYGRWQSMVAAMTAATLPFTLLPIIAWSTLMRVDLLATSFTFAGVLLAVISLRRPQFLYASMLCFVAACMTKQTFLAAPVATVLVHATRSPRSTARAVAAAGTLGLSIVGALTWLTDGGFLRHIFLYNMNQFRLATAFDRTLPWLVAYSLYATLVAFAVAFAWRDLNARCGAGGWRAQVRHDDDAAALVLLTVYLFLSSATLALAGKSGASYNYFVEFFCLWCVWIGWLAGRVLALTQRYSRAATILPLVLATQILPVPGGIGGLHATQLSPARSRAAQALLNRTNTIKGRLLSDDMVTVLRAHREVGIDPFILAELATNGTWDEGKLIGMLNDHAFGAIITAYGPGDPTFDSRYLPRTQAAMLANYPEVEKYGDYTLRLPRK